MDNNIFPDPTSGTHLTLCGGADLRGGDLGAGGVHDEEEPVHGDQHDREGGEEDAAGLGGADQLAQVLHVLPQAPVLGDRVRRGQVQTVLRIPHLGEEVNKGEGHGEGAEEDVGDGEVGDEDVPGGELDLVGEEGEEDREVADHAEDDDEGVEHDQAVVNTGLQSSSSLKFKLLLINLK